MSKNQGQPKTNSGASASTLIYVLTPTPAS
jgi:hypothetical protein